MAFASLDTQQQNLHCPSHHIRSLTILDSTVSSLLRRLHIGAATLRAAFVMAGYSNGSSGSVATAHTLTALNRWSVAGKKLPGKDATTAKEVIELTWYSC